MNIYGCKDTEKREKSERKSLFFTSAPFPCYVSKKSEVRKFEEFVAYL